MLEQGAIEDVTTFTYLGSKMSIKGGTEEDIQARIGRAQAAVCSTEQDMVIQGNQDEN